MPAGPIVPIWRLSFPYVVDGFSHVCHKFLNTVPSADPSGYDTVARTGHSNAGVSTVTSPFWTDLASLYHNAGVSFGNAHLDRFIGGAWVPVWYETNAVVPIQASPTEHAAELVFTGYSTAHGKYKLNLLESFIDPAFRTTSLAGTPLQVQTILVVNFNLSTGAADVGPYSWERCRDGNFIGTFISVVASYNKHWRRKRGLG